MLIHSSTFVYTDDSWARIMHSNVVHHVTSGKRGEMGPHSVVPSSRRLASITPHLQQCYAHRFKLHAGEALAVHNGTVDLHHTVIA